MRSDRFLRFTAAALALAGAPTSPALASSCDREIVVHIKMVPGKACWSYRGAATMFVGDFSHGARIAAQMMGLASETDPRSGRVATFLAGPRPQRRRPGRLLLRRRSGAGRAHLRRPLERKLPVQLFALRDVGRAGRGQDLRALRLSRHWSKSDAWVPRRSAGIGDYRPSRATGIAVPN